MKFPMSSASLSHPRHNRPSDFNICQLQRRFSWRESYHESLVSPQSIYIGLSSLTQNHNLQIRTADWSSVAKVIRLSPLPGRFRSRFSRTLGSRRRRPLYLRYASAIALESLTELCLAVLLSSVSSITSASTSRTSSLHGLLARMNPRPAGVGRWGVVFERVVHREGVPGDVLQLEALQFVANSVYRFRSLVHQIFLCAFQ